MQDRNGLSPQIDRKKSARALGCAHRGVVKTISELVQSIGIQVPIKIKCHGCGLMPKHLLDELDCRAGGDRQTRGGVPQFVQVETGYSELLGRASEHRALKDLCAEGAAPLTAEDEVIRRSADAVRGQIINQETGERYLPAYMALRCTPGVDASDQRDRLGDGRASAHEVEPTDAQGGHFAESDAGIGKKEDDWPGSPGRWPRRRARCR